jgi:short-subunit dehydrogenase
VTFATRYGPWALITGASEGTGRAFARKIAAQGLNCILLARREAPLLALADEIRAESGVECVTASVDLSSPEAIDQIVSVVGSREVGLFVSNAGADPNGSLFLDADIERWIALLNINVTTLLRCCHHFGAAMRQRGRGGLLVIGSGACYGGGSFLAAYSASKAFQLLFTESLWAELRPHNVDVLYFALSTTDTPAFRELLREKGMPVPTGLANPDDVAEMGLARLPHGPVRNWGAEDDVAGISPTSPDDRRARILFIDEMTKGIFGER